MLKVELRKHLNKSIGVSRDTSLDYVREIINGDSSIEKQILSKFGSTNRVVNMSTDSSESGRKDLWLGKELQNACRKFALRMVPLNMYNKPVPATALAEMRAFIGTETWKLDYMFIVCPKSHIMKDSSLSVSDPLVVFDMDCSIETKSVLQQDNNSTRRVNYLANDNGSFKYVTSWGGTFSWFRRVKAFFTNDPTVTALISGIVLFLIAGAFLTQHLHWYWKILGYTVSIIVGFFAGGLSCAALDHKRNYSLLSNHKDRWLTNCK